jgi:hypothetical protein
VIAVVKSLEYDVGFYLRSSQAVRDSGALCRNCCHRRARTLIAIKFVYRRHGNCGIIQAYNYQEQIRARVGKRLTTALVFALTVNLAVISADHSILGQSEDQRSTEKREDLEVTKGGAKAGQSKWAQYSPRADGSMSSKRDSEEFDSAVAHTEVGMNPTIAIFLGLSVLLVVVVAAGAASRADVAKRHGKIRT